MVSSQTLNGYAYGEGNPVLNIDPNGTWSIKKAWKKTKKKGKKIWANHKDRIVAVGVALVVSAVVGAMVTATIASGGTAGPLMVFLAPMVIGVFSGRFPGL